MIERIDEALEVLSKLECSIASLDGMIGA